MSDFEMKAVIKAVDKVSGPVRKIINNVSPIGRQFQSIGRNAADVGKHLSSVLAPLAIIGSTASIAGLTILTKNIAAVGNSTGDLAAQVSFSTKSLQEWEYIAKFTGASAEQLDSGLQTMTKSMAQLRANAGPLVTAIGRVSPALLNQLKACKSNEEAFELMLASIRKVEDPLKKAYLASTFFGSSGPALVGMANTSKEALAELRKEALRTGNVMDEQAITASQDYTNNMDKLRASILGVSKSLVGKLLPVVNPLIARMTAWIAANRQLIEQRLDAFFARTAEIVQKIDFESIIRGIGRFAAGVGSVVKFIGGWENATWALVAVMNAGLIASVVKLSGSIIGLLKFAPAIIGFLMNTTGILAGNFLKGVYLATRAIMGFNIALLANPIGLVIGGIALLAAAGIALYKKWEPFRNFIDKLWGGITKAFKNGYQTIKPIMDLMMKIINPIAGVIDKIVSGTQIAGKWLGAKLNPEAENSSAKSYQNNFQPYQSISDTSPRSQLMNRISPAPTQQKSKAEVVVRFDNMPDSAYISAADSDSGLDLGVETGHALPSGVL